MDIRRVNKSEYAKVVTNREVFFNEPEFCELNRNKVDDIHYVIFSKNGSDRFGMILGEKDGVMKCPFSAPYSYPVEIRKHSKIQDIDESIDALDVYCHENKIQEIRFVFPPLLYNENLLSGWISGFYRKGYQFRNIDINFSYNLVELCQKNDYAMDLSHDARKALAQARRSNMSIEQCKTEADYKRAYDIVKLNHDSKGRPTWIDFDNLMKTFELVKHDVYIIKHEDIEIASAILYEINDDVVQWIYSGVIPEATKYKSMNFLVDYMIKDYYERGYKYLDSAISTEDSVPNYGLCDFKESTGCKRSLKYSFCKKYE